MRKKLRSGELIDQKIKTAAAAAAADVVWCSCGQQQDEVICGKEMQSKWTKPGHCITRTALNTLCHA